MEVQGFFTALFDIEFKEFITTRVIKFVFILGILCAALGTLALIVSAFVASPAVGVLALLFSPVAFLLYIFMARIWCEIILVLFRIAENTSRIPDQNKPGAA